MREGRCVRICTYNVLHGKMTDGNEVLIGHALKGVNADIVGLQEVDVGTRRIGGRDLLRIIAAAGEYPYFAFCRAIDLEGGEYGTAVLSRYPILTFAAVPLPSKGEEGRSLGHAVIDPGEERLDFFNTHLSYTSVEERAEQLSFVAAEVRSVGRYILTGDFNTEDTQALALFEGNETLNPRAFLTYYPTGIAIDHILVPKGTRAENVQMPTWTYSDHYPLIADVYL